MRLRGGIKDCLLWGFQELVLWPVITVCDLRLPLFYDLSVGPYSLFSKNRHQLHPVVWPGAGLGATEGEELSSFPDSIGLEGSTPMTALLCAWQN